MQAVPSIPRSMPRVARALAAGARGGARVDADLSRPAASAQPRTCAARSRRRSARPAPCRPRSPWSTADSASAWMPPTLERLAHGRRRASSARRATSRWSCAPRQPRCHHRRRHHPHRRRGRHPGHGDRRHRRRASRRRGQRSTSRPTCTSSARTGVAVVCSGAKIILDLPRTLEVLETLAVPVVGLPLRPLPGLLCPRQRPAGPARGRCRRRSRPWFMPRPALGWPAGIVIANPPPAELALAPALLEGWIAAATAEAASAGHLGEGHDAIPACRAGAAERRPHGDAERGVGARQCPRLAATLAATLRSGCFRLTI